jgi:acyl carrier protein
MTSTADSKQRIFSAIVSLIDDKTLPVSDETALIGDGSVLDSMKLVELCLVLEDMATELGFEFDWTSDTAMSRSRSMFRTAGTLANEFIAQGDAQR